MSLSTPILNQINAFDATQSNNIFFSVVGGDQVSSNRLLIKDNVNAQTVYDNTQTSYSYIHSIPAGTLTNGGYYVAQVQTFNNSGDSSPLSVGVQFYCFTTPTLIINNMPSSKIIQNSSFVFSFTYSQAEGELLYSYKISLYDQNQVQISTSGTIYNSSTSASPTTFTYEFNGLTDGSIYYISSSGATANGTQFSTGMIRFSVSYWSPLNNTGFVATNDACNGWITISNQVKIITAQSMPDPPIYINNKEANLTYAGSYVKWGNGLSQKNDFTIRIWGRDFNRDSEIFRYSEENINYYMNITYRYGYDFITGNLMVYADLNVSENFGENYYIYSNFISVPTESEQIFFWLRRIQNIYQLKIENMGVVNA